VQIDFSGRSVTWHKRILAPGKFAYFGLFKQCSSSQQVEAVLFYEDFDGLSFAAALSSLFRSRGDKYGLSVLTADEERKVKCYFNAPVPAAVFECLSGTEEELHPQNLITIASPSMPAHCAIPDILQCRRLLQWLKPSVSLSIVQCHASAIVAYHTTVLRPTLQVESRVPCAIMHLRRIVSCGSYRQCLDGLVCYFRQEYPNMSATEFLCALLADNPPELIWFHSSCNFAVEE
jgi:hypothetical protein